jgi:hypothetical protein
MPHRPGHGTQRRRIERQARGQTATPINKGAQQAANTALVNAEINRLNRFVDQNQDKKQQFTVNEVIKDMPDKFQDNFKGITDTRQMNEAQKAIFNFYNDGRSDYQRQLNRFVQSSPESAQAFAQRFPLENFLQKAAPVVTGIMTGLPLGAGTIYDQSRRLGTATIGGLKDIAMNKGIIPRDDINPDTGTTAVETDVLNPVTQNIFTGQTPTDPQPIDFPSQFTGATPTGPELPFRFQGPLVVSPDDMRIPEARRPVEDVLPTDAITEGLKSLFTGATPSDPRPGKVFDRIPNQFNPPMIPGGNPRGEVQSARLGALLGSDPNIAYGQEMNMLDVLAERARRGFNEGGLASINNPQYNMLMKASDFDI